MNPIDFAISTHYHDGQELCKVQIRIGSDDGAAGVADGVRVAELEAGAPAPFTSQVHTRNALESALEPLHISADGPGATNSSAVQKSVAPDNGNTLTMERSNEKAESSRSDSLLAENKLLRISARKVREIDEL